MNDSDLYAEGWREGVRQAHLALRQEGTVEEAMARLEALMVADHRYKVDKIKRDRRRKGAQA